MLQYLKFQDSDLSSLQVSEVTTGDRVLITFSVEGYPEQFIELDYTYTKELVKFLNQQLKTFKNG